MAVLLYGGFDFLWWLARDYPVPTTRAEWWTMEFGFFLQFSNFMTLAQWVPHHLVAAVAIGFALFMMQGAWRDGGVRYQPDGIQPPLRCDRIRGLRP